MNRESRRFVVEGQIIVESPLQEKEREIPLHISFHFPFASLLSRPQRNKAIAQKERYLGKSGAPCTYVQFLARMLEEEGEGRSHSSHGGIPMRAKSDVRASLLSVSVRFNFTKSFYLKQKRRTPRVRNFKKCKNGTILCRFSASLVGGSNWLF